MTPAEGRRQRRELMKEIAREHRRQQKEHLHALRAAVRDARAAHRQSLVHAKHSCRTARLEAARRASELRARLLAELRVAVAAERAAARTSCSSLRADAKALKDARARARAGLDAERAFRRDMRRIERGNRARRLEIARASHRERASESDDEVRGNIQPELRALFERVRARIKGSGRRTRTEAFLQYAEENPREVLASIEDEAEVRLRDLEAQARRAERAMRRPMTKRQLESEVPF